VILLKQEFKRFIEASPSKFRVIGFLVSQEQNNFLTGEKEVNFDIRLSSEKNSVDLSPFLGRIEKVI
jgi:hypothetical protein